MRNVFPARLNNCHDDESSSASLFIIITKCDENQPDAAETDRGRSFDCDRVYQTLSLIEKLECV